MIERLQRQIFKDHLVRCRQRLADARSAVAGKSGLELGNAILLMHERQSEFRHALNFMWEAQGGKNEEPTTFDPIEHADRMIEKHADWDLQNPGWNLDEGTIDPSVLRAARGNT